MRKILVFAALICVTNIFAHREATYYLYANIKGEEMAFQLNEYGNACVLAYSTEDSKYNCVFEGETPESGKFEMCSYAVNKQTGKQKKVDSLFLEEYELNRWKGTWFYNDGEILKFELDPINVDLLNHPYISAIKQCNISPYIAYKTKDVHFDIIKKEKLGKGAFVEHLEEPNTHMKWFRIVQNDNVLQSVDSINNRLIADYLRLIGRYYNCTEDNKRENYTLEYDVRYLGKDYLSYSVCANFSSHKSVKSNRLDFVTLFVKNAKPVSLENIFWFGDSNDQKLRKGSYEWFQYRYNTFGPKVLDIMKTLYPKKFSASCSGCNYDDVKMWQLPDWCLTKKGLYLGCCSALWNYDCNNPSWSVIPYKVLKNYRVDNK